MLEGGYFHMELSKFVMLFSNNFTINIVLC